MTMKPRLRRSTRQDDDDPDPVTVTDNTAIRLGFETPDATPLPSAVPDPDLPPGRRRGHVKSIKQDLGFGFVTDPVTCTDYFFHKSSMARGTGKTFADLSEFDRVEFTPIESPKGMRAIEVRPL